MEHSVHILTNGLKLVYSKNTFTNSVHMGYLVNFGSSLDGKHLGMAHLIEHMIFKGTNNNSYLNIIEGIENDGGEINAYTTRDYTAIYAQIPKKRFTKTLDILSDIVFSSNFPLKELKIEKKVILEEINMYKDNAEENIMDEFFEKFVANWDFSHNILGTEQSLKNITQADVLSYFKNFYTQSNVVLFVAGNIPIAKVIEQAQNIKLAKDNTELKKTILPKNIGISLVNETIYKEISQAHLLFGFIAPNNAHVDKWIAALICNYLGGPMMSSKLNLVIRETNGLAYHTETAYHSYLQLGIITFYIGCDKENTQLCTNLLLTELEKLQTTKISKKQLAISKRQIIGQSLMAEESIAATMLHVSKSVLQTNTVVTMKEAISQIKKITEQDIMAFANTYFKKQSMGSLAYLPNN